MNNFLSGLNKLIGGLVGGSTYTFTDSGMTESTRPLTEILSDYVRRGQREGSKETIAPSPTPTETPRKYNTAPPTQEEMKGFEGLKKQGLLGQGYDPAPTFRGFKGPQPEDMIANLIQSAAMEYGINPSLLAAVLFQESRFNPQAVGASDPNDIGIAQINMLAHPQVTRDQAFDPTFAIPYAAQLLSGNIEHFGDVNRGVAAYNVGRGGASVQGPEAYGGGPLGQTYIDNVSRNLEAELIKELGLILSPGLLAEY